MGSEMCIRDRRSYLWHAKQKQKPQCLLDVPGPMPESPMHIGIWHMPLERVDCICRAPCAMLCKNKNTRLNPLQEVGDSLRANVARSESPTSLTTYVALPHRIAYAARRAQCYAKTKTRFAARRLRLAVRLAVAATARRRRRELIKQHCSNTIARGAEPP